MAGLLENPAFVTAAALIITFTFAYVLQRFGERRLNKKIMKEIEKYKSRKERAAEDEIRKIRVRVHE